MAPPALKNRSDQAAKAPARGSISSLVVGTERRPSAGTAGSVLESDSTYRRNDSHAAFGPLFPAPAYSTVKSVARAAGVTVKEPECSSAAPKGCIRTERIS